MNAVLQHSPSQFQHLSILSNREGIIAFALQEGIPVLRASKAVQECVEELLQKQQETGLSDTEREEFESYEEIDDYLSLLNRLTRNLYSEGKDSQYTMAYRRRIPEVLQQ